MPAIPFHAAIQSQVAEERERVAEANRPGRLRTSPPNAWRGRTGNGLAARIDSLRARPAITERGQHRALRIDFCGQNPAHEEVRNGIAFAMLCLPGSTDEL